MLTRIIGDDVAALYLRVATATWVTSRTRGKPDFRDPAVPALFRF
jgi:hypothetical protein